MFGSLNRLDLHHVRRADCDRVCKVSAILYAHIFLEAHCTANGALGAVPPVQ